MIIWKIIKSMFRFWFKLLIQFNSSQVKTFIHLTKTHSVEEFIFYPVSSFQIRITTKIDWWSRAKPSSCENRKRLGKMCTKIYSQTLKVILALKFDIRSMDGVAN